MNAKLNKVMHKIIIITGQTATGKTRLAFKKAVKYNGVLINADSRQVYKHLDIITGKDLTDHDFHEVEKKDGFTIGYYLLRSKIKDLRSKIWLYDIVNPKQYFSSYDYETLAIPLIKRILDKGKTPVIVGGTYLYLYHLLYEIDTHVSPNWELRKELDNKTVPEMQAMLKELNPELFESLNESDRANPRRLMRKIEITLHLEQSSRHPELDSGSKNCHSRAVPAGRQEGGNPGFPIKSGMTDETSKTVNDFLIPQEIKLPEKLGIKDLKIEYIGTRFKDKEALHKAIEKRVKSRLKLGAIHEVETLLKKGYTQKDPGMQTIGYKEIIKFLKIQDLRSKILDQLSLEWQIREHQYAKRQYTFMKKDPNIKWIEV